MNELQKLIKDLNNFDYYYQMSDSDAVYDRWNAIEKQLKKDVEFYKVVLTDCPEISIEKKQYWNIPLHSSEKRALSIFLNIIISGIEQNGGIATGKEIVNLINQ